MGEQSLLHHVLHAARGERRATILLLLRQFLAQPGHRPIEMMQIEPLNAGDGVVLLVAIIVVGIIFAAACFMGFVILKWEHMVRLYRVAVQAKRSASVFHGAKPK